MRKQHGLDETGLMLINLCWFGYGYRSTNDHVLSGLFGRFHESVQQPNTSVSCWSTGNPQRQFVYVDDLGEDCVFSLAYWQQGGAEELQFLNVGKGVDLMICELAEQVADSTRLRGYIHRAVCKSYGASKKQLHVSRLAVVAPGGQARISMVEWRASMLVEFAGMGSARRL